MLYPLNYIVFESKSYKAKSLGGKIEDFGKVYGEKEKLLIPQKQNG